MSNESSPRLSVPCSYNERRLVYIVMGLSNSGKTTKVNELVEKAVARNLKCTVCSRNNYSDENTYKSALGIRVAEGWCNLSFLQALDDLSVRRIFIDNNNLEPEFRQYYIDECEKRDIEWCILRVGKFTNTYAQECLEVHGGGSKPHVDWAEYRRQLQLWGEYYQAKLRDIESLIAKGYEQVRTMSDTRLIATRLTSSGREVVLGISGDGSYIRAYIFNDAEVGLKFYKEALNVTQWVNKAESKITVGRRYNGSLVSG